MRCAVRLRLNRVESRHSLVRNIFFANQGAFKTDIFGRPNFFTVKKSYEPI